MALLKSKILLIVIFTCNSIGLVAQENQAIDSILKNISKHPDSETQIIDYYNIAKLYLLSDFDSAHFYYEKAIIQASQQKIRNKTTSKIYLDLSKLQAKQSLFDEAQKNCNLAINIANEINDDSLIIVTNLLSAKIKVIKNDFSDVLAVLEPSLEKAIQLEDSILISECYDAFGSYYYYSDVAKSVDYYIKSLRILEQYEEQESLLSKITNIGSLLGRIGQNEKAVEYLLRGVQIAERTKQDYVKSTIYNNLAVIYYELGDNEKSKYYLEEALVVARRLKDEPMICGIVVNLGELYQGEKQFKKAMEYYNEGLNSPAIENLPDQKIYTLHNIATLHYDLKDYQTAIKFAEDALSIANTLNITMHNAELYKVLAESYEQERNFEEALKNQKLYKSFNDSLFNIQNTEKIAEIQAKYDFDAAENENILLKKDNEIQALTIEKQKNQQLLLLILLVIILVSIFLISMKMNKDRKTNRLLSAKNEEIKQKSSELEKANAAKDKFFSILAHDLRNPFNSILGSLEILQNNYNELNDEERLQFIELINKSAMSTNRLLSNLLDWSMIQRGRITMEKRNNNLTDLINEAVNLHQSLALKKKITIENKVEEKLLAFFDKKTISVSLNNLINNAIKFTPENGKVAVMAFANNGNINVSVKDNGIGISADKLKSLFTIEGTKSTPGTASEPGTGLGLVLCKEFIEQNDGQIKVTSSEGKGSCFEITLPAAV